MFLFYDWPFLHVCNLHEKVLLFSILILCSVFSNCRLLRAYQFHLVKKPFLIFAVLLRKIARVVYRVAE